MYNENDRVVVTNGRLKSCGKMGTVKGYSILGKVTVKLDNGPVFNLTEDSIKLKEKVKPLFEDNAMTRNNAKSGFGLLFVYDGDFINNVSEHLDEYGFSSDDFYASYGTLNELLEWANRLLGEGEIDPSVWQQMTLYFEGKAYRLQHGLQIAN